MKKPDYKAIIQHCDREEILNKLLIDLPCKDIAEWLAAKYATEKKLIISEKTLKNFKDNYLDFYNDICQDVSKSKQAIINNKTEDLELVIRNNPRYKDAIIRTAENTLDVELMMTRLILNIETRLGQIFDVIQDDPNNVNTRLDRLLIEVTGTFGNLLDTYYKHQESREKRALAAAQTSSTVVNNNITISVINEHISTFQQVIKEVLAQLDLESSLYFMEVFNTKMSQLKMPSPDDPITPEMKMAEVKLLNEKINEKINQQ